MGLKDNEDGSDKVASTDYGEIAKAIYKMKQSGIEVHAPSINNSSQDFTPREESNTILFGLSGIAGINREIAQQIISNRPYDSFEDFYQKNSYQGSLITSSKFIQLIKAGCFDEFEANRNKIMKKFVILNTEIPKSLTAANLPKIIKSGISIPKELVFPYKFYKYVCSSNFFYGKHPAFKSKKLYWLDEKAKKYFNEFYRDNLQEEKDWFIIDDKVVIVDKSLEKMFKPSIEALKQYINTPEFLKEYRKKMLKNKYDSIAPNKDINHWSFEACSFYSKQHELADINLANYMIAPFDKLPKAPNFIVKKWGEREWHEYDISRIAGTVIDKNDNRCMITLLDLNNNVINIRFPNIVYAKYKAQISDIKPGTNEKIVRDKSWFSRGNLLILTGYRRGDNDFVIKKYKSSIFSHVIQKIEGRDNDGNLIIRSYRWGEEPEN